ncbi:MAG: mechanosensitive ion channel protein MscS [Proteobacteria bacterium]|nr:MAG: mechanosensitive ion channel protein MscS [Pseudomonadota bacterium]
MEFLTNLLNENIFGISVQNLLIATAIFAFCVFLRSFLSNIILGVLKRLSRKTKTKVDDKLINAFEEPFKFSFIVLGFYLSKQFLHVEKFKIFFSNFLSSLIVFVIFWTIFRLVNEFNAIIAIFSSRLGKPLNKDIENFIIKSSKVIIIILGFLMILQSWGVNITAFIASLGLGGLAFALAAKDTASNLFGSLVIFADRPFKVGDTIELNGIEGSVEEIGIRSTRIRTYERSLVAIPNAIVAHSSIANWTKRNKRRCKIYIGLTYDTNSTQMEKIISEIAKMIKGRKDIDKDSVAVYFEDFDESSLNILCHYHVQTTSWTAFLQAKQEINMQIMKIVEENGSDFAFPSRTIYTQALQPKEI